MSLAALNEAIYAPAASVLDHIIKASKIINHEFAVGAMMVHFPAGKTECRLQYFGAGSSQLQFTMLAQGVDTLQLAPLGEHKPLLRLVSNTSISVPRSYGYQQPACDHLCLQLFPLRPVGGRGGQRRT